ncbi:unnamed protein product [Plutella xylostella]|uniref:(diamondback moth) hypothetical protein n=1 Tax=Plutella xylostella TaxID=51655 RepID=A0A8S4FN75_PLUXY|nr:unnamed protein product [Plutella xylostella]
MAADDCRQLRLLLWKDYLIRKRKLITLGGVVWATLVVLSLYIVRANIDNQDFPTCQFPARALPSAGMLTFLQSFICSVGNQCEPMDQYQEIPLYENSRLTQLQRQFSPLLRNSSILATAAAVPDALRLLGTVTVAIDEPQFLDIVHNGLRVKDLFVDPARVRRDTLLTIFNLSEEDADSIMQAEISFQGIFKGSLNRCDPASLSRVLLVAPSVTELMSNKLCPLNSKELQDILVGLLLEVDYSKYIKMIGQMYSKLNGDTRILELADTLTAALRMTQLDSFVPPEVATLFAGQGGGQFTYYNLTIISKLLDRFEPIFKDTEAFRSVRSLSDAGISGAQWLYKIFSRQTNNNSVEEATGLVIQQLDGNLKLDGVERLSSMFKKAVDAFGNGLESSVSLEEVFQALPKVANFVLRWLSKEMKHTILFYSTLLTKLIEGAHKVILNNMSVEQIAYNVSARHPAGVRALVLLPPRLLGKAFDGLADADRTLILSSKLNAPGSMFCDAGRLQRFFQSTKEEAASARDALCVDPWRDYVVDLIQSLGILDVKVNINSMASLLIQETLGKDTTDQLYPIDKMFQESYSLIQDIQNLGTKPKSSLDWNKVLGVTEDSEFMKIVRKRLSHGSQVLITVHGSLAKEVIKQNTILDIKITPILLSLSRLVTALNSELAAADRQMLTEFKMAYPAVVEALLRTFLDAKKTYRFLSTHAPTMFCNGSQTAAAYIEVPPVGAEDLVTALCGMTRQIEGGLRPDSFVGKALKALQSTPQSAFGEVPWTALINGLRDLYTTLLTDYTYIFQFATFNMDEDTQSRVKELLGETKEFWFGRGRLAKSLQLSINVLFRVLDVIDRDIFNLTNEIWLKIKYTFNSARGLLVITDEVFKMITALTTQDSSYTSNLPPATAAALSMVLPNLPRLVVDAVELVVRGDTDVTAIISTLTATPPWPCTSLAPALGVSTGARGALRGAEAVLCGDQAFLDEWSSYEPAELLKGITNLEKANTTKYPPHVFLTFSSYFDALIEDADNLRTALETVFKDNSTSVENPTIMTAWNYAVQVFNRSDRDVIFRNFFTKLDTVLNAVNTTTTDVRDSSPLNILWEDLLKCGFTAPQCRGLARAVWQRTVEFVSVFVESVAVDLRTYFQEINEPDANIIQLLGFTRGTGLYVLYEKMADFAAVLLHSYWDYGFMNQVRRASKTQFWDCDSLVESLVIPPDSAVSATDLRRVRPYVCPSLLYWVSLPRGENRLLDVVSKPQYYFYTMQAKNLTSRYEGAFNEYLTLTQLLKDISNQNKTKLITKEDINIKSIENKVITFVDSVLSYKINETDPSYRLFNEVNKKHFLTSIYLTRVVTIIHKVQAALEKIKVADITTDKPEDEVKKIDAALQIIQKKFKRRPAEAIGLHFDVLTDVIWNTEDNYTITDAIRNMCKDLALKSSVNIILADGKRFIAQICSKPYEAIYEAIGEDIVDDIEAAKQTLLDLVEMLKKEDEEVEDIFEFFNKREAVVTSLKLSIKYSDDLNLPIYLKYLQNNLQHYNVVLSFLSGGDWWSDLRQLYNTSYADVFFDVVEHSPEIARDVLTHLDQIHLVRLLRAINSTDALCLDTPLSWLGAGAAGAAGAGGRLEALQAQLCAGDAARHVPMLRIVSQGYDNSLTISREINYDSIYADINTTESNLQLIRTGPSPPTTPAWVTEDSVLMLRSTAKNLFTKESLTKLSFGVLGNLVDASTLFLNNSQCKLCSKLTTWFKQLNLQLFKKQDYDSLMCHVEEMSLEEVYHTLKNDFHWDMALKELISTRNYTTLELNKAVTDLLEQLKLHVLDDVTASTTKLQGCLAGNLTANEFSNATLFVSVLSHTIKLIRAQLPHIQEISGMKEEPFLQQLHSGVAHNLHVTLPLKEVVGNNKQWKTNVKSVIKDLELVNEIGESQVDLLELQKMPHEIARWMLLQTRSWDNICNEYNCTQLSHCFNSSIDMDSWNKKLPALQSEQFWRFSFISPMLHHASRLLSHISRLLGVASFVDIPGVMEGEFTALIDTVLQVLQEDVLGVILYSLEGFCVEVHPVLSGTPLDFDLAAVLRGLQIIREYRTYVVENMDLKLPISQLFPDPDRLESALNRAGVNNTNFWALAAPMIQGGYIDLMPLLNSKDKPFKISRFLCSPDAMSQVLLFGDRPGDAAGAQDAVVDQLCGGARPELLPTLLYHLNYTYVVQEISKLLLSQVYSASNLTQEEGATVLAQYRDMMALIPVVQENVGELSGVLGKEPVFAALRNFESVGGLLSSSDFLSSAGNMLCGTPFASNENRFYKAVVQTRDYSTEPDPEQLEVLPTDFCRSLYTDILSMNGGKIVWSFVKPLLMGRILYTPASPSVYRIVEKANSTFALMSNLTSMVHKFSASFPSIRLLSQHGAALEGLRTLATTVLGEQEVGGVDVKGLFEEIGDLEYDRIMATATKVSDTLMVSEVLAFVQNKLDSMDVISLEQICLTSFKEAELAAAKKLLADTATTAVRLVPRRGDGSMKKDLQDIIRVFQETDPDNVPTYVARDLYKLPPVTFDHVDVTRLLKDIVLLKSEITEIRGKLEASEVASAAMQRELLSLRNAADSAIHATPPSPARQLQAQQDQLHATDTDVRRVNDPPPATYAERTRDAACPLRAAAPPPPRLAAAAPSTTRSQQEAAPAPPRPCPRPRRRRRAAPQAAPQVTLAAAGAPAVPPRAPRHAVVDKDGFILVEKRSPRRRNRNKRGTAPAACSLKAAMPTVDIYVSRIHANMAHDNIMRYIKERSVGRTEQPVQVLAIERLQSAKQTDFKSFRLRVPADQQKVLLNKDFWPAGIVFRRYREAKKTIKSPAIDSARGLGTLLRRASDLLRCLSLNRFHPVTDEDQLARDAANLTRVNEFAAGLVFTNIEERGDNPFRVEYKIRMDIESVPSTSRLKNQFWTPGPQANFLEDMRYFRGFVQIQDLVDTAIIQLASNRSSRPRRQTGEEGGEGERHGVYTQQIPYPCYRRDFFQSSLYESQALIVVFFFALLFSVSSAIRFIVAEKESGNTMLMSVMGVNLTNHTLSWFLSSLT